MVSQKRIECLLRVGSEFLPQVEELKYLRVLFTSDGRLGQEIDISNWEKTTTQTQETLERLHLSAGLGVPLCSLRGAGGGS